MDDQYLEELFSSVKCPLCEGRGTRTVSGELSHDEELCTLCRGEGQVPAVVAEQFHGNDKLTRRIVDAAASIVHQRGLGHGEYLVLKAYERAVINASALKSLLDVASPS